MRQLVKPAAVEMCAQFRARQPLTTLTPSPTTTTKQTEWKRYICLLPMIIIWHTNCARYRFTKANGSNNRNEKNNESYSERLISLFKCYENPSHLHYIHHFIIILSLMLKTDTLSPLYLLHCVFFVRINDTTLPLPPPSPPPLLP